MIFYLSAKTIERKNIVLLIFSLVFYAWGEPKYILLLLFMSFADWILAILIYKSESENAKKLLLITSCLVNLGLIGIFKYTNFIVFNFTNLFSSEPTVLNITLPIGISFYTFQLLSYVVDVYRGDVKAQPKYHIVLLYASLFHQCIAGPIVRYRDVEKQLLNRRVNIFDVNKGINRFCIGLGKKAIIANTCGKLFEYFIVSDDLVTSSEAISIVSSKSVISLWIGMLLFSLQIYFDFSAYSDMAIGMGKMIGIDYKENFDYPYTSSSVSEFWRRWHISLGSFFRDYVYIPLGGNRKGIRRTYINLFITWLLTGLWHGASWNYIFWGLYFFIFIALEKAFLGKYLQKNIVISKVYSILIVFFGWVLFKFENTSVMFTVLRGMFGLNGNNFIDFETTTMFTSNILFIIASCIICVPIFKNMCSKVESLSNNNLLVASVWTCLNVIAPIILIFLSLINIVGNSYNPFLYFQF
jgi:alginate O-acetyltransferase complex protein AlgI